MKVQRMASPRRMLALAISVGMVSAVVFGTGCKQTAAGPDDASLTSQVQNRLSTDPNLSGQTVQASAAGGVVTLTGNVTSETARTIASGDVGAIAGVKTVVNNLLVQAPPSSAAVAAAPPEPMPLEKPKKTSARVMQAAPPQQSAPIVRNEPPAYTPAPAPSVAQNELPPPPPPPPAPVVHNITLPAGTSLPVRITQTLDSATTQTGDKFTGAIASDIVVDGLVVLPQGANVTGHVDEAKDATHFKGSSALTISLTSISRRGERIDVVTEAYTKEGEGRGKNTAEKVGGGAAVGAILGGIFGGGKGAAIGAAAGGGVGAGAQGITRGQQVQIPSESVVRFRLTNSVIVRVTTGGGNSGDSGPGLERRNQQ